MNLFMHLRLVLNLVLCLCYIKFKIPYNINGKIVISKLFYICIDLITSLFIIITIFSFFWDRYTLEKFRILTRWNGNNYHLIYKLGKQNFGQKFISKTLILYSFKIKIINTNHWYERTIKVNNGNFYYAWYILFY